MATARLAEALRFLTFRLGQEVYGVPILNVREIIELQEISPVPRASPGVRGVVNLRGRVLPVLDPKVQFGIGEVEASELTVIMVLQTEEGRPFGVLVDEVLEVLRLEEHQIATVSQGDIEQQEFLSGFGKVRDGLVFLLDPHRLRMA